MRAPLFRDPVTDGATDPVLVQHPDGGWWMLYTQRRPRDTGEGVAWVHGSAIGVARHDPRTGAFAYAGTLDLPGVPVGSTCWAPEVLWADGGFHMFLTVVDGVPTRWEGHPRRIEHHVSDDLEHWRPVGPVTLSSDRVIDACVAALPSAGGARWRMWFKDEADGSTTWAADSADLHRWEVVGRAVGGRPHEGPNVFSLGGWHWLVVDEWRGQGVYRSTDMTTWERQGLVLDRPGSRPDDGGIGMHADVVVPDPDGAEAYVVYFTHPGRREERQGDEVVLGPTQTVAQRRSSVQVALLRIEDGMLRCDRDEPFDLRLPRRWTGPPVPPA